ncbi:MAG TPA: sugar ABC transporter, partial [Thalassospira lucentensis]|nr:sugar ABC transporter [Thalassospira lucentensis]
MKKALLGATLGALALSLTALPSPAKAADIGACLVTKTDINPFFVKMKEGASAKAEELGIDLSTFAGKV